MNEDLGDYMFHYNIHTKEWAAFLTSMFTSYRNGTIDKTQVIKNKDINKLIKTLNEKK